MYKKKRNDMLQHMRKLKYYEAIKKPNTACLAALPFSETDHSTARGRNVTYHRLPPPSPAPQPSRFKTRLRMLLILGTCVFSGRQAALNLHLLPEQAQQLQLRKNQPFLKPFSFYPGQKREPSTYSCFSVLARQLLNIRDIFKSS